MDRQHSPTSGFEIFTDSSGNITQWNIALSQSVSGAFLNIDTENLGGALVNDFSEEEVSVLGNPFVTGLAKNTGMPATWTMSTAPTVPEPGSLALLAPGCWLLWAPREGSGLASLGASHRWNHFAHAPPPSDKRFGFSTIR